MSDQSSHVDIGALAQYGSHLIFPESSTLQTDLLKPFGAIATVMLGTIDTDEAQTFAAWYKGILDAYDQFSPDAVKGCLSLGSVAVIMAANYRHGDLSQSAAMDDVLDAFSPSKGDDTVDKHFNTKAATPKVKPKALPKSHNKQAECKAPSGPEISAYTPQEQWNDHQRTYAKYETWKPHSPDPKAQPKPIPPPSTKPQPPTNLKPDPQPLPPPTPPPTPPPSPKSQPPTTSKPGKKTSPCPEPSSSTTKANPSPKPSSASPSSTPESSSTPEPASTVSPDNSASPSISTAPSSEASPAVSPKKSAPTSHWMSDITKSLSGNDSGLTGGST